METTNKIPKKIHYCRFWWKPKPNDFLTYLETWKKNCPDYEIIEWNENNFDINSCEYSKKAYENKKWAFVVDYVRFAVLEKEWWIYMDTDVEVCKNLDRFLTDSCFLWFQEKIAVDWAIIWAEKNHPFVSEMVKFYKNYKWNRNPVLPYLTTKILRKFWLKTNNQEQILDSGIHIYKNHFFYPFAYYEKPSKDMITDETYAIHWYRWSWLPAWVVKYSFPIIWVWKKIENKLIKRTND